MGNHLGGQSLPSILGNDYRVHQCIAVYLGKHIAQTFTVFRPGLVVINPERVNHDNLPPLFHNRDKILFVGEVYWKNTSTNFSISKKFVPNYIMGNLLNEFLPLVGQIKTTTAKAKSSN